MTPILAKFASRKFWMAAGSVLGLLAQHQWSGAAAVASAYILAEGAVDHARARTAAPAARPARKAAP